MLSSFFLAYQKNMDSVPTLVISPWVEKGALEHLGKNDLIYSHSSLPAFISKVTIVALSRPSGRPPFLTHVLCCAL